MRKADSGWRDSYLAAWHSGHGFDVPAAGVTLPMVEYDRGVPVGIVNYIRRGHMLPGGPDVAAAYMAYSRLYRSDGAPLPFLTCQYDPSNWAMRLFPHNLAAKRLLDAKDWVPVTEYEYVAKLYELRGRYIADELDASVVLNSGPWSRFVRSGQFTRPEVWPGEFMSQRRREYEPEHQTRFSQRNPCVDADLTVVGRDGYLALVVDYKASGTRTARGTNSQALSSLFTGYEDSRRAVPAMMVQYAPQNAAWGVRVHPLNLAAQQHLAFALGHTGAPVDLLAEVIGDAGEPDAWHELSESQWLDVLRVARDL